MKNILRFIKTCIVVIHYPVTIIWRRIDMLLCWPDLWPVFRNVPNRIFGGVGGDSYTGWVYQSGLFMGLIRAFSKSDYGVKILDFGCGYSKIGFAAKPVVRNGGKYIGIDIMENVISFCKKKYANSPEFEFHLSKDHNLRYNPKNKEITYGFDWPVGSDEIDIVTSISVFTHLIKKDAIGYMHKIHQVLKKGGIGIITFHIVNENLDNRPKHTSILMPFLVDWFTFDTKIDENWYTADKELPETIIGISQKGINELLDKKFKILKRIVGSTTGGDEGFPQDILVIQKI